MKPARRPTHRAFLEGSDATLDLRELLNELAMQSPSDTQDVKILVPEIPSSRQPAHCLGLRLHRPTFRGPCHTYLPSPGICVALTSLYQRNVDWYSTLPKSNVLRFSKKALLVDLLGVVDRYGKADFGPRRPPVHHLEIDLLRPDIREPDRESPSARARDASSMALFTILKALSPSGSTFPCRIWHH